MSNSLAFQDPVEAFLEPVSRIEFRGTPGVPNRPAKGLRILYTGPKDGTCLQRAESLRSMGAEVVHVRSGIPTSADPSYQFLRVLRVANRIKRHPDFYFANSRLLKYAKKSDFDIVWIDKGLWLRPRTLCQLRAALPDAESSRSARTIRVPTPLPRTNHDSKEN